MLTEVLEAEYKYLFTCQSCGGQLCGLCEARNACPVCNLISSNDFVIHSEASSSNPIKFSFKSVTAVWRPFCGQPHIKRLLRSLWSIQTQMNVVAQCGLYTKARQFEHSQERCSDCRAETRGLL
jgi:hypothetical protein